jgi:hypothetical protein
MLVLAELINSSIGQAPSKNSVVCACVSSPPVDGSVDGTFHKSRLIGMFKRNGWNTKIIDEGYAVILSENPTIIDPNDGKEYPFSGLGISMGAGKINCVFALKGIQLIGMSCGHSGDFIDKQVSEQTGSPLSQVITKKEKYLDFNNIDYNDDVMFALDVFYDAMIKYVFNNFAKKFNEVKREFDAPLTIVIAGGTSMPKGFCSKLEKVIKGLDLPFEVKEIRHAASPRNTVVLGCLAQAIATQKKLEKNNNSDFSEIL